MPVVFAASFPALVFDSSPISDATVVAAAVGAVVVAAGAAVGAAVATAAAVAVADATAAGVVVDDDDDDAGQTALCFWPSGVSLDDAVMAFR